MTDSSDSSFDISSDLKHKIIIIVWVGTATFAMVKLALDKKCSRRVQTPPHTSLDGSRKSDPAATARLLHQLENCSRVRMILHLQQIDFTECFLTFFLQPS
jgi:hypothetical protein